MKISKRRVSNAPGGVMAYVVLALGVLMAAAGLYSVVFGYPLIETEHGPASLIAGSVLLSGGIVVVALGLAIRVLAEIRAALGAQSRLADETAPIAAPTTPLTPPAVFPALAGGGAAAAAVMKAAEPPTPVPAHDTPETRDPEPEQPEWHEHAPNPHAPDLHESDPREPDEPMPGLLEAPRLPAAQPLAVRSDPGPHAADTPEAEESDAYELQTPSTPDHDIVSPGGTTRAPSEEEDWLDRALSDFESGLSSTHPAEVLAPEHAPAHAAEEAAAAQAEVPPIHPEPALSEPATHAPAEPERTIIEPAHAEPVDAEPMRSEHPAAPAHEPAPHDLAVIGRYESDGTSYIMYADGSIEAQSEAGVYRFRSMAELKAFIEG